MASKRYGWITMVLLITGGTFWYFQQMQDDAPPPRTNPLARTLNECDQITEKAAANLTAVVEFQKLEIIGRKAAVFKRCMVDRGYRENPQWTKFVEPLAITKAKNENTSLDEAFENLRREKMKLTEAPKGEPVFWVPNH
jgi:hypothetical protein